MMVFWVVALLLIAAALLFLLPPLAQRNTKSDSIKRDEINVLLYKDQTKELDADLASGVITQEQYDQAKQDLERSLIEDVSTSPDSEGSSIAKSLTNNATLIVALFIPLSAILLYQQLGAGETGLNPEDAKVSMQAEGHQGTIEEQVRQLQEHLQSNPDDTEGWVMLARSYYFMKQYQGAADAFARTVSMTNQQDAQLLADYADALAMASGRSMTGKPFDLVKQALAIKPTHEKSLWLAASATYQSKAYEESLGYWQRLLQQYPKGSDNYKQILRNFAEVKQLLGQPIDPEMIAELNAPSQAQPSAVRPSSTATTTTATGSGGVARVTGSVSLDPALSGKVSQADTVFVFARAASGPRMPLAIVKKQVKDLPIEFNLDDSMAMNPSMKLSAFADVVVGARISKSGNAMPQSGDLKGSSSVIKVGTEGLKIIIDSAVP